VTEARAVFAGPGARRALVDGARGEIALALSAGGAYVRLGSSDWLLLTRPSASFGPLSVTVDGLKRIGLRPGAPASVRGTRLVLGDQVVSCERVRVRSATAPSPAPAGGGAIASAAAAVRTGLPTPPARLRPGIAALAGRRPADGIELLAGLGDGLTPAGDDVLAGYAATRFALAAPVCLSPAAAERSSSLGLAYLRCAERGELPDAAARLLAAICRGSGAAARAALAPLRSWGSTSGFALAWGMNAAVLQLTEMVN
jgi:Protein of unknown function (DUF2877)